MTDYIAYATPNGASYLTRNQGVACFVAEASSDIIVFEEYPEYVSIYRKWGEIDRAVDVIQTAVGEGFLKTPDVIRLLGLW